MTARNEHTGVLIKSKPNTEAYSQGWERIFGKKDIDNDPWYVAEYNSGVFVKDIYYKALSQEDTEAQNWLIEASGVSPEELLKNI